jgi:hypothetical protein
MEGKDMSRENLIRLLDAASSDQELASELENAAGFEEVKSLAGQRGFDLGDLSAQEANRTVEMVARAAADELSDGDLEQVAGGFNIGMPKKGVKLDLPNVKGFSFGVERE